MKIEKISLLMGVILFSLIPLASYSANNSFTIKNNTIYVNIAQVNSIVAYSTLWSGSAAWKVSAEKGVISRIVYKTSANSSSGNYVFMSDNVGKAQQKKGEIILKFGLHNM